MSIEPRVGLVIRYDFLWKDEQRGGRIDGAKDRPCVVILMTKQRQDGRRYVAVAPITHSPIRAAQGETGVKIPAAHAGALGLDDEQSYLKTHELNTFLWEKDRIPFGVVPARKDRLEFGQLHDDLTRAAYEQVRENQRHGRMKHTNRDEPDQ